jgi:hypothetical protein
MRGKILPRPFSVEFQDGRSDIQVRYAEKEHK